MFVCVHDISVCVSFYFDVCKTVCLKEKNLTQISSWLVRSSKIKIIHLGHYVNILMVKSLKSNIVIIVFYFCWGALWPPTISTD